MWSPGWRSYKEDIAYRTPTNFNYSWCMRYRRIMLGESLGRPCTSSKQVMEKQDDRTSSWFQITSMPAEPPVMLEKTWSAVPNFRVNGLAWVWCRTYRWNMHRISSQVRLPNRISPPLLRKIGRLQCNEISDQPAVYPIYALWQQRGKKHQKKKACQCT